MDGFGGLGLAAKISGLWPDGLDESLLEDEAELERLGTAEPTAWDAVDETPSDHLGPRTSPRWGS